MQPIIPSTSTLFTNQDPRFFNIALSFLKKFYEGLALPDAPIQSEMQKRIHECVDRNDPEQLMLATIALEALKRGVPHSLNLGQFNLFRFPSILPALTTLSHPDQIGFLQRLAIWRGEAVKF